MAIDIINIVVFLRFPRTLSEKMLVIADAEKPVAVAGVIAGVYFAVKKYLEKKNKVADCEENYVSCSCCEAEA